MEVDKFEGRVSLLESKSNFKLLGTSGEPEENYNSFIFCSNHENEIPCMFGSKYILEIYRESLNNTVPYRISLIDGVNVDNGCVSMSFESAASDNVTNTSILSITLIVPNTSEILKKYKIDDTVFIRLNVHPTREDSLNG